MRGRGHRSPLSTITHAYAIYMTTTMRSRDFMIPLLSRLVVFRPTFARWLVTTNSSTRTISSSATVCWRSCHSRSCKIHRMIFFHAKSTAVPYNYTVHESVCSYVREKVIMCFLTETYMEFCIGFNLGFPIRFSWLTWLFISKKIRQFLASYA